MSLVYLLTLVPLITLGLGLLYQWYSAHLTLVESDRLNNARLVATAFETFARDLSGASMALGQATLDSRPAHSTPDQFTVMTNSFPLHFSAVLDDDNRVIYANDARLVGRVLQDPAIDEAHAGRTLSIGESRVFDGDVGFMVAQALANTEGEVQGVAVQYVDPERLARRLTRNPISGGGASIVDSAGTLVVLFERPELGNERQYWGNHPAIRSALRGHEAIDRDWIFPLDGERRIGAAVPVGRLGWEASSAVPYDLAMAPFLRSLSLAAGIGLLILIMSGTAAGLMGRSLLRSVSALREQSLIVGDRDRPPAEVVRSGDELEDVSRVLHATDKELRNYITGLEAIGEAGRTLSAAIGTGDVDDAIVTAARELFGAESVWILQHDDRSGQLELATWYSSQGRPPPTGRVRPGQGVAGRVFSTGDIALVRGLDGMTHSELRDTPEGAGLPAFVETPLERAGRPFGVLGISAPGTETWLLGGREVGLLRAFGNEVATVLENARLYENERFVADTLQQSLLTLPDRVIGVRFAHSYHAATQTARVGGDFYDLFEIEDRVGIVIGDVAGHGLDAAVLTSLVKNAVRAHADEPDKTPTAVVELTNELIVKESRPESFVTLFVGVLDLGLGVLTYCNAGHTTGALLRSDGTIERLSSTSMLVGAFAGTSFEQASVHMSQNDILFLYTDGLTEARRDRELYGEPRLFELLERVERADPWSLVESVLSDIITYTDGELSDDLALLAVQRNGTAGVI